MPFLNICGYHTEQSQPPIFLQKLHNEYNSLFEKYWILMKFSDEVAFQEQVIDILKYVKQTDHATLCMLLDELEVAYDRLYHAPYGPHFVEGLKLCINC